MSIDVDEIVEVTVVSRHEIARVPDHRSLPFDDGWLLIGVAGRKSIWRRFRREEPS